MFWSTWRCRQTITAVESDAYKSSLVKDGNLVLGRNQGFLEVYKIGSNLRKRIEFRSHSPCFDYLRSAEIAESVDAIGMLPSGNKEILVLSSNAKTVKLWNIHSTYLRQTEPSAVVECCSDISSCDAGGEERERRKDNSRERLSRIFLRETRKKHSVALEAQVSPENTYSLHSLSVAANGESFLVADELAINIFSSRLEPLWKTVNLKPANNEEISKVICTAKFVDRSSHLFVYGASNGSVEIRDLRECTKSMPAVEICPQRSHDFYGEIIRPVSDIQFINDHVFAARNLLAVQIHDIRAPHGSVLEHDVLPLARKKVSDLYDSDEIFTKFKLGVVGNKVYTGSFNTGVAVLDIKDGTITRSFLEAEMEEATRIVDRKKITCVSAEEDCLVATMNNQCYIFRQDSSPGHQSEAESDETSSLDDYNDLEDSMLSTETN
ncbi:serine/threonine-protein phosphatase 2A regulatory subunit B [Nematocida homosporus]|uniref:serine/threonine-protein phosphatase 2A regulatory subunit B n=1 Tax=Nematocida homosporus TaxID=1912981 RepID=UPI00221F633A|nr:serine/threonine-protein phosphatase 2A regulatory subunit B [Nematocida homosporus]KAI5185212.1 serine/threonine-protein phosphatase 2A regulatory subunit B [Nematocida homosporus]